MELVIGLSLLLVIGTYDLKTTLTLSMVQFALFFEFWFQPVRRLDSTILDALYSWALAPDVPIESSIGVNNAIGDLLLNFSMATILIAAPPF